LVPALAPRVQVPALATPAESVVAWYQLSVPAPAVTSKLTSVPACGLPCRFFSSTVGRAGTAVATVPVAGMVTIAVNEPATDRLPGPVLSPQARSVRANRATQQAPWLRGRTVICCAAPGSMGR